MYAPLTLAPQTVSVTCRPVKLTPPFTCSLSFQPVYRNEDSIFDNDELQSPVSKLVRGYDQDLLPRIILVITSASTGSAMYCVRNSNVDMLCDEFAEMFQAACAKTGIIASDVEDLIDTLGKSVLCLVTSLTHPNRCQQFVADSISSVNHLCGNSAVLGIHYQYDEAKNSCVIDITEIYAIDEVTALH